MQEYQPFLDFKNAILADAEEGAEVSKNSVLSYLYILNNVIISSTAGIKSGFSENKFLLYLKLTLGEKIKTGVGVSTSTGFDYYFPDFVYYDDLRKIYVDIEIDEPYDLQTGKPIHCNYDDVIRNDFFVSNFWAVIRFSEKQVITEPGNCIKTIQSIVKSLEDHTLNWTSYVIDDSSWDEETALQMEKQGYREQYLGIVKRIRVDPFKSMSSFEDKRLPRTFDPDGDLPF